MKKKVRKAAFSATVIFTLALSLQSAVQAQASDNDGCTLSTLKGDYGLRISGQIFTPPERVPREPSSRSCLCSAITDVLSIKSSAR